MRTTLPDVKLLQIFEAVVRHQGFTPAAAELSLSASAISTYMSQLERQLGIVLCRRGRGGFALTSKGTLYHAECVRILTELDRLRRYGHALQGGLHGRLVVGAVDATVTDRALPLAAAIGRFGAEHPNVHITFRIRTPGELQAAVLAGDIDVAVGSFSTLATGLVAEPLHREQHWLYCADAHPLYALPRSTAEEIARYRVVSREYWINGELEKLGFTAGTATVDTMEAQLVLILSGLYLGFLPEHYAEPWLDRDTLRVLQPAFFGYQARFTMIHHRNQQREPLVTTLREHIREHVTEHSWPGRSNH